MTYDPNTPPTNAQPPAYTPPAAPPAAPAAPAVVTPAGPKTLGLIAFAASVVATIVGSIISFIAGQQLGGLIEYTGTSGTTVDIETLPASAQAMAASGGLLMLLAFLVFGILALWGFIQGIIATVKKRGRGWAITAIVIAVVGGGIVGVFFGIGFSVTAAPYLATMS